ncbi:MAG: hypothetical protein H6709_13080 [Kofleriaceae bacterium]|nr:hypothetical protein [Myxococcales bacterium]MCB9573010.1 hypothetical protein [Kofleriaceae bacterium]
MQASHHKAANHRDINHYFEYSSSGIEVVEDGLAELPFGEYLVERGVLDRVQLLKSLQMQDRNPGVRLGECAAALGYVPILLVERAYREFVSLSTCLI